MKDLSKSGLSIVGVLFAGLLLAYTGYQTFSLLLEVSGSPLIAAVGLIMFEAGMIYWWFVFRNSAEGLLQMALSFLVFLACLTFVVMATALKLGAVDAAVLGVNTPAKIITAAAVIQLTAKLFFPIFHPETMRTIGERAQEGKILSTANSKFEKRIDGIAQEVADGMVEEWTARLTTNFNTKYGTRYQLTGAPAPVVIEGQSEVAPAPRLSFVDRMLGRRPPAVAPTPTDTPPPAATVDQAALMAAIAEMVQRGELVVPVSQNTQTTAHHDTSAAPPSAGQGQRPNGPPAPTIGRQERNGPNF